MNKPYINDIVEMFLKEAQDELTNFVTQITSNFDIGFIELSASFHDVKKSILVLGFDSNAIKENGIVNKEGFTFGKRKTL